MSKDYLNFTVGPVSMSKGIAKLGSTQIPYFRTKEFSNIMFENERLFLELIHAPINSKGIFITGSGTAAMDAIVSNLYNKKDKLLIINGGTFGQRFVDIVEIYNLKYEQINLEKGKQIRLNDLKPYYNKGFTSLLVNMHETSTGLLYDMDLISKFSRDNNMLLVVDAISSFIADPLNMTDLYADVIITGSQKALALPPGLSLIALSEKAVNLIEHNPSLNFYLNLKNALNNQKRGQTPFTPAVGILLQLNKRLNYLSKYGLEKERLNIIRLADHIRKNIKKYNFKLFAESPSNCVTALKVPNNIDAKEIFEILKNNYNIFVVPSGGELSSKIIRIGHIGALTIKDNEKLLKAFNDMKKRGIL